MGTARDINDVAGVYYIKVKNFYDEHLLGPGPFVYTEVKITIIADCTQETITLYPAPGDTIADITYVFNQPSGAETRTLPSFVSSRPTNCSIMHELEYYNPSTSLWEDFRGQWNAFISYNNITQAFSVEYTTNN